MIYILSAVIGYFLGCVNMAYIVSKARGVNIKSIGTNNAGASNVFISVGKVYGIFVGVFDVLKSFAAAEIVYYISGFNFDAAVIAGVFAVAGHIFPFWMKFNGGKGLAPFMGIVLFYNFWVFIIFAAIIAAITLISDYIALGALTVSVAFPLFIAVFEQEYIAAAMLFALGAIMWYKHKENIKRIKNGTEIGFLRKNKGK